MVRLFSYQPAVGSRFHSPVVLMSAATFSDASLSREAQRFVVKSPFSAASGRNSYSVVQGFPLTMLSNTSSDFDLTIRQQPDRARVAGGKEKGT